MYATINRTRTSRLSSSVGSDATIVLAAFLVAVVVSFTIVHPAYSYTIPRRGLGPCGIGVCDSNSALAIQWNRRINNNLSNNKNNNNNIVSTRLQMSYQPSPPTPQEDETSTPSNDDPKAATTESSRRSRRSSKDEEKEPTLYEILNASPDATRSELKKQYATLARVSHPDAQKNDETIDFQQIAEAWNTLGNPQSRRRYDRQLKAKAWGEAAQRLTNERLEQVAPVASSFMDNLAVPFLKRTSATTFAVGKAIATGLAATKEVANSVSSKNGVAETSSSVKISKNGVAAETAAKEKSDNIQIEKNSASTTTEAVETADNQTTEINGATTTPTIPISIPIPVQKNSTTTDDTSITTDDTDVDAADADTPDYQLNEKSLELQELAKNEEEKAKSINDELDSVKEQRLFASLQSSEYALTSSEAEEVLENLTGEDTVPFVDRTAKKTHIEKEILSLRNTEKQFTEKLESYSEIDREWTTWLTRQEDARETLKEKLKEELEAREALNSAEEMLVKASTDVTTVSNKLRGVEQEVRRSAQEMDRVSTTLSRKQERVRNALRRKTELMRGGIQVQYITVEEVKQLRRAENQLIGESQQIATMVARLQSRADNLKKRADALERLKNN